MNFSKNSKAFLKAFPLKELSGHQMLLALAAYCVGGNTSKEVKVLDIRTMWPKAVLKKSYNPSYYNRAQQEGWVDPVRQGVFMINEDGLQHLIDISSVEENNTPLSSGKLFIFEKKSAHSFDKFLRSIFAKAKSRVAVADSWVDEKIFDNVLDSIPKIADIKLIYGQKRGTFDSRVIRFRKEYNKFVSKKYSDLHDRFLVIDDVGYVLGPSIKDAASNSPALVVRLSKKDSLILVKFFQALWTKK